jgi:hypothetical protein
MAKKVCILLCISYLLLLLPINANDTNVAYISDLPTKSFVSIDNLVHKDKTYKDIKITVGKQMYDKGISMHPVSGEAPAEVVYDISNLGYTRFTAIAGKDLTAGSDVGEDAIIGSCVGFQVWVDDVKKADSGNLPYPYTYLIDVDVKDASILKLVITDGGDGIFCDAASYADAKLIRDDIRHKNGVDLNSLTPKSYIADGDVLFKDTTWLSQKITVGGIVFEKGISMSPKVDAPAEVIYDIEGLGYTSFTALAGKDKTAGLQLPNGDEGIKGTRISFEIWVDGVKQADSGSLTYPRSYYFNVDITNAKELKLITTDGGDGYYCDTASWANPTLWNEEKAQISSKSLTSITPESHVSYDNQYYTDTTSLSQRITVGKIVYEKGLSMHPKAESPAELIYDISGLGFTNFSAICGKDRTAGLELPDGDKGITGTNVSFEVWVDGAKKADSGALPYPYTYVFDVDITNANELKLVITDGGDGIYCDSASWANPILYKFVVEQEPPTEPPTNPATDDVSSYITLTFLTFIFILFKKRVFI